MSRGGLLRAAAAAAFLAALAAAGCELRQLSVGDAFDLGRSGLAAFKPYTWEEELEIGGTVAAHLASRSAPLQDRRATRYVNLVAATVAGPSCRPDVLPRVLILDDNQPNAFACPGGYVFVTRGLLRVCRDESELAGVLSHEFTHVAKKHTLEGLKSSKRLGFAVKAGGTLTPQKYQETYQAFSGVVGKAVDEITHNRHSRADEEEADLVGAECAVRAGYDGAGLARVAERLPEGPAGQTGWKEFSIYADGATRGQRILKRLAEKGLAGGGATCAARYKRELAGVLR